MMLQVLLQTRDPMDNQLHVYLEVSRELLANADSHLDCLPIISELSIILQT
jgi:hypothetical protein